VRLCVLGLTCASATSPAGAAQVFWSNPAGGLYSEPANWMPNGLPGPADTLFFTNAVAYTLRVDVDAANSGAVFRHGSVTQTVAGGIWRLQRLYIGDIAGITSRLTSVSGSLIVTNATGTGVLSAGGFGTGELAIGGGDVTTDLLQATNGTLSILTFGHGELTTLRGATVQNAGKLILGTTSGGQFVWNAVGGTNQIITGQFVYGGLTLGAASGGGRARINLTGSNTLLSVPGLDTYGRNELYITRGADFRTYSVQLGLQTGGSNNVVVISGPGSSWINDYLMYFGMHSGGQTMIITNGGYFKTGGTLFPDQTFHSFNQPTAFNQPSSKIIITGSNSWFHSDGTAVLGQTWSSPVIPLNNLLLVKDGGRFWARQLTYGSTNIVVGSVSRPGNVIQVDDGSVWIGSLTFAVGTLRIEGGTGVIDQLNMTGGTNALLQTLGTLYIGHRGELGAGDLRIGHTNTTIASLNGELRLGGWQIGASLGATGEVSMLGGRAFVTNASRTASLVVGNSGHGVLRVTGSFLEADLVTVGPRGKLFVTNSTGTGSLNVKRSLALNRGLLRVDKLIAPTSGSTIDIHAGKAEWASCDLGIGVPLRIGDGLRLAILNILGGTNLCPHGLEVLPYSRITGSGTIVGPLTNRGALWPSVITVRSNLVLDPSSEMAFSIAGPPGALGNSLLVVTANADLAGNLRISVNPGATPSGAQIFVLIQYGSMASAFSNFAFGQRLLTSNRLASFRIDNTGAAIVATDFRSEDLDGDGIQDAWALQQFGMSPLPPGTATNGLAGDWDGDGITNRDEFLFGSDPKDPRLLIRLEMTRQNQVTIHFPYWPQRSYHIAFSDDLLAWTQTQIDDFPFDNMGLAVWGDTSIPKPSKRFYRLLATPQ
jgi:T5SS/PEP-CTERM-associated repeat protein